ncbi:MAG: DUF6232 family protein [Anaerolineae bacterium]
MQADTSKKPSYLYTVGNIKISKQIIHINGTRYSVKELVSFSGFVGTVSSKPNLIKGIIVGGIIGFVVGIVIASLLDSEFFIMLSFLAGMVGGAILGNDSPKDNFSVRITFTSGETATYTSSNEAEIDRILDLLTRLMRYVK